MKVGKDSVVIGNVPQHVQVGDGSVVIGATDAHGNTIINTPMAVGRGAHAGSGSIAIGAFASAGLTQQHSIAELQTSLQQFAELVASQNNEALVQEFNKFKSALQQPKPDKSLVFTSWEGVRALATVNGAHSLLAKISATLASLFGP